ncbi:MAG: Uma2 family endonuclease [Bacteroidota bacterium]
MVIKGGKVKGCPDLIIEVLSPGNIDHDKVTKKAAYEKFGVKEYFIVDPATKVTFTWYLTGKKYVKQLSVKGKIKSKLLKKTFSF